jgi:pimeloyl-ACP methyl ester carboxylesterase
VTAQRLRQVILAAIACTATLIACTASRSQPVSSTPTASALTTGDSPLSPSPATSPTAGTVQTGAESATGTGSSTTIPNSALIKFNSCTAQIAPTLPTTDQVRVARLQFACGTVSVPVDYAHPTGKQYQLYVVRVHDRSQVKSSGSLIVNPGGPGASGYLAAINLALSVPDDLLAHFDLVGFDPRGVFASAPVSCISDTTKDALFSADPDVRTAAGLANATATATAISKRCASKYPDDLTFLNTENTARDMDAVRQGVGESQLNYLGYSYGSKLGAVYASLFPATVRAMVLDGAVDVKAGPLIAAQQHTAALEAAFDQFAAACVKQVDCKALGDPRPAVTALIAAADLSPIPTKKAGDSRMATGASVREAIVAGLASQGSWVALGKALISAQRGDSAAVFALADGTDQRNDGHYSNLLDAQIAVTCNDTAKRYTGKQVQQVAQYWANKYPLFGLSAAASLLTCDGWPVSATEPTAITTSTITPILVIGTRHDPFTPYSSAQALTAELDSAVLLTWDGSDQTSYPKTTCIQTTVDTYLVDRTVPKVAVCPLK